jgi:hypothetical protein
MKQAHIVFVLIVTLFSYGATMNSGGQHEVQKFLPRDINGWKAIATDRFFDQESIFDYIDGSGEVYRSYNFKILFVRQYDKPKQPAITVDFFDMGSSADAYGVFTHDYEDEEIGIGQGSSYLAGSLAFWKDRYFVSIWAEEETESSKRAIMDLGKAIESAIPQEGEKPQLLKYLPQANLNTKKIRFLHSYIVLNYHYFVADENILHLNQETDVVLAEYNFAEIKSHLLLIQYPASQLAEKAYANFISHYLPEAAKEATVQLEDGKWTATKLKNDKLIIIFDAATKTIAEKIINDVEHNLN